jgi:hypothetical protein
MRLTTFLIHCFIPILSGGLIYIGFRSESLRLFTWLDYLGLSILVSEIRQLFLPIADILPSFIIYSLPDGLWAYSFTFSLRLILQSHEKIRFVFLMIPFTFSIIVEVLQAFHLFQGTFDWADLFFSFFGYYCSKVTVKSYNDEK